MKIANAPCSWGVLEFELDGEAPGYAQVLDEMHQIGYIGTELGDWGFMPTDAKTPPCRTCGTRVEDVRSIRRCRTRR